MKIIVGLGNPGKEYEDTRHNVGYMFLDALVGHNDVKPVNEAVTFHAEKKFEADIAEVSVDGEKLLLVKPTTFMNSSGRAVAKILDFYKVQPKDLIVASDDIDLPLGIIRIRKEGGSGGQKGLQNIIDSTKSEDFVRVRIGISEPGNKIEKDDTVYFVLGKISKREEPVLDKTIAAAVGYLAEYLVKNEEIPCHTIQAVAKEQSLEK